MRSQVLYSILGMAALLVVGGCQKQVLDPPSLKLDTNEFTAPASGGDVEVPYVLENGVEGAEVSVDPVEDYTWVTGTRVESSSIYVTVTANDTEAERVAEFTVSYPGITKALEFSITQDAGEAPVVDAPVITLEPESAEVSAAGESGGFNYTIENPADDGAVSCEVRYEAGDAGEWVTCDAEDLEADGRINYTVEANEGEARTAYITVSYPGAEDVEFTISQAAAGASSDYDHEYTIAAFMGLLYEEAETYDNYQIYMSSLPLTAEGGFDLTAFNYTFDVYAAPGTGGAFPEGEYVLGEGSAPNTIGQAMSSFTSDGYETTTTFTEGTMTVSIDGENYVFDVILKDDNGETHHLTYTGLAFEVGGDEPSDVTFEISVDNLTYEGYTYSIVPSDKEMSYIHLGTPKDVLVQNGAMTEDGDLNEYVLHDDVISPYLLELRDMLVHTGDLTDATALFPASSSQDVVVLCYGIDAGDNRITPVTTYEFTMPAMPAVITLDEETIEAGAGEYNGGVYYSLGGDYDPEGTVTAVVQNGVDWVRATVDPVERYIDVSVDPNDKPVARTATITVSHPSVDEPAVLTVYQEAGELVLTENSAWTVSYFGKTIYNGQVTDAATVVSTSNDTYLQPIFISKADYESRGLKAIIEEDYAIWEYTLEYYGGMYTWEDFLYDASGAYIVEYLEDTSTEYYALVYGVDTDGVLTGYYALSDSFYPEEITVDEGYNKWLGTWRIEDASGVGYDVVISEAVAGATYAMTGWQSDDVVKSFGQEYPVSLTYDSESQSLMFAAGQLGTYDAGYVYFLGTSEDGLVVTGNYNIASASFEDGGNTAKVTPMEVALSDGSTFVPYRMQVLDLYYGQQWYIVSDQATVPVFPLTMEKVSSSSSSAAPAAFSATLKRASADGVKKLGKIEPAKIVKFSTKK